MSKLSAAYAQSGENISEQESKNIYLKTVDASDKNTIYNLIIKDSKKEEANDD